ncbi:MAG: KH domain-containing protein [bacterium]
MKEFVEFIAKHLVENPDLVHVDEEQNEKGIIYKLTVGQSDLGRVVGREGRTARSMRTLLMAACARRGFRATLEIVDKNYR